MVFAGHAIRSQTGNILRCEEAIQQKWNCWRHPCKGVTRCSQLITKVGQDFEPYPKERMDCEMAAMEIGAAEIPLKETQLPVKIGDTMLNYGGWIIGMDNSKRSILIEKTSPAGFKRMCLPPCVWLLLWIKI